LEGNWISNTHTFVRRVGSPQAVATRKNSPLSSKMPFSPQFQVSSPRPTPQTMSGGLRRLIVRLLPRQISTVSSPRVTALRFPTRRARGLATSTTDSSSKLPDPPEPPLARTMQWGKEFGGVIAGVFTALIALGGALWTVSGNQQQIYSQTLHTWTYLSDPEAFRRHSFCHKTHPPIESAPHTFPRMTTGELGC
jgi:hypothetical protein